jgi:hypothetical protein
MMSEQEIKDQNRAFHIRTLATAITAITFLIITALYIVESKPQRYEVEASKELVEMSRNILRQQVGVTETIGNNDSPMIRQYLKSVNINYPQPYCMAGQYYCYYEANKVLGGSYKIPLPKSGVAIHAYSYAKANGNKTEFTVRVDDLLIWKRRRSWSGHVERVITVMKGGYYRLVGFNTMPQDIAGSQREGQGVHIRVRKVSRLGKLLFHGVAGVRVV